MDKELPRNFLKQTKALFVIACVLIILNEFYVTYISSIPNTGVILLFGLLVLAIVKVKYMREPGMLLCTINAFFGVLLFTYLSMFTDIENISGVYLLINQVTIVVFLFSLYYSIRTYINYIKWKHDL